MLVQDYLIKTACRLPAKEALVCGTKRMTYQEISSLAGGMKGYLKAQGLQRGDRVAVFLDNGPEAVIAIFGILEAGGCIVVTNPATQVERLTVILRNSRARFVVTTTDRLPVLAEAELATGIKLHRIVAGSAGEVSVRLAPTGVVRVAGEAWQAELSGGGELAPGEGVRVERVEGLKLFVTPLPQTDNPPPNESAPQGA